MTGTAGGGGVFKESGLVQLNNRVKYLGEGVENHVCFFEQMEK